MVTTLPHLPAKPATPQNQVYEDQFTIILEEPGSTLEYGGFCSEYTFRVQVKLGGTTIIDSSGNGPGDFDVLALAPSTTYTVILTARNQAGWGEASDALEVSV